MNSDNDNHSDGRKVLSPAAQRALQEAEERRKAVHAHSQARLHHQGFQRCWAVGCRAPSQCTGGNS